MVTNRDNSTHKFELFAVRLLVVIFVVIAHFAMFIFYFSGLKIAYINHMPWPYKDMWRDFCSDAIADGNYD